MWAATAGFTHDLAHPRNETAAPQPEEHGITQEHEYGSFDGHESPRLVSLGAQGYVYRGWRRKDVTTVTDRT